MRPKLSLCRVPLTLTLTMPDGNIRSHEALHNWSRLANAALRPVTMTMLEAIEAPALRRWRGALHANNLDGEMVTAVLNAHRRLVVEKLEAATAAAHPRPLSQMTVAELRSEAMLLGFDITVENLRTRLQLQETLRSTRPAERQSETPDFSKMLKPDLIIHCRNRGIDSHGLTCDRMRLALQNWTPPTSVHATVSNVGAPAIAAGMTSSMAASSTTVPLQPVPETKSRAPMLVPTAPREPRTPPMTRTEDGFIKAEHPKLLWCPVHQGPLIMRQNPGDRSLFLACDMYPICKVTMPPWKAPPPGSPPHRGPSVSATAKAPPGFSPQMIAQQQEVNAASDRVQADHQQATAEGV